MKLFMREPRYTQEEINSQVHNLERLNKLRDICTQRLVLAQNARSSSDSTHWQREIERYIWNIETAQLYLNFMMARVAELKRPLPGEK